MVLHRIENPIKNRIKDDEYFFSERLLVPIESIYFDIAHKVGD
jgi:hypothetical protein